MSGNVTNFPRTEPRVWVCNCGCRTFELLDDGSTVCANCEASEDHGGGWASFSADRLAPEDVDTLRIMTGNAMAHDFVRARTIKVAGQSDVVRIVVELDGGAVVEWTRDGPP